MERRYDMEEILALKGGKNPIRGVTYNALEMLRNPLYVKMAQEMKDESMEQAQRVQAEITNLHEIRNLAGQTGLPADVVHQMVQTLPQGANQATQTEDPDEDMDEPDEPMDPKGGDGGDGGGGDDSGGSSGGGAPPGGPEEEPGPDKDERGRWTTGNLAHKNRRDRGGGGAGSSQSNSTQMRSQLQMQAELEEVKRQMRKQESQNEVMREYMNSAAQRRDPMAELTKEVHNHYHVSQNAPAPPIVIREQQNLNALYQAIQEGRRSQADLVAMGLQLGLAHAQIMHLLAQEKKDEPVQMQSSSSSGGPPPDDAKPKAKAKMQSKRVKEAPSPADEKPPKAKSKAAPKAKPPATPPKAKPSATPPLPSPELPLAQTPSPAPTMAPTVRYDTPAARGRSQEPRSRSTRGKGPEEFSIATPRASSEKPASTPHTKSKADKIVQQLIEVQNDQLVKSNVRRNLLGKFAKTDRAGMPGTTRKNPMLVPQRAKTYEEVHEAAIIGEKDVPFGAAVNKQRIDTPGKAVRRYQGQRIRPT